MNKPIIIYEESLKLGSLGSILAMDAEEDNFNKLYFLAIEDTFYDCASREELIAKAHLTEKDLEVFIKKILKKK